MPPRCPNGTRRNRKSGNCESTAKSPKNKSVKNQPIQYSFSEICKIASELYGVSYTYFFSANWEMKLLYNRHKATKERFVFPSNLKKIMIGSPAERYWTRTPYTGKAIKKRLGISAKVDIKDMTRDEVNSTEYMRTL